MTMLLILLKAYVIIRFPKALKKRDFNTLETDLKLMVEAGINTLRVYSPIEEKSVLDKIECGGDQSYH